MNTVFPGSRWVSVSDVLPDGTAALVTVWSRSMNGDHADIYRVSLETLETERLVQRAYDARLVGSHRMTFVRGGTLFSVGWNGERSGEPRSVVAGVRMDSILGQAQYAASPAGTLVYVPGDVQSVGRVARVDRRGHVELLDMPERIYCGVNVAPDGKRLALSVADIDDYVWIYDIERREGRRLTEGTGPVWTLDGRAVAFSAVDEEGAWRIRLQSVGGTEGSRDLHRTEGRTMASSWAADGRTLAFYGEGRRFGFVSMDGGPPSDLPADPESYELFPSFSPDGRWVAFVSLKTGRFEVWVRSHPDGSRERQISVDQGIEPVWCENGELFYRTGSRWMVTSVTTHPELSWDPPRHLFTAEFIDTPDATWDVSPDGQYVYLLQQASAKVLDRLHVMTNAFGGP